jgi:hypothetical protein
LISTEHLFGRSHMPVTLVPHPDEELRAELQRLRVDDPEEFNRRQREASHGGDLVTLTLMGRTIPFPPVEKVVEEFTEEVVVDRASGRREVVRHYEPVLPHVDRQPTSWQAFGDAQAWGPDAAAETVRLAGEPTTPMASDCYDQSAQAAQREEKLRRLLDGQL